jgi:hypothetical protein
MVGPSAARRRALVATPAALENVTVNPFLFPGSSLPMFPARALEHSLEFFYKSNGIFPLIV